MSSTTGENQTLNASPRSILIVEDEAGARRAMVLLLTFGGYTVEAVDSAENALELLEHGHHSDVALVDLDLPGMDGVEFIGRLIAIDPNVRPILITANDGDGVLKRIDTKSVAYFRKPFNIGELLQFINHPCKTM
jgi:CheY-like chemotaxis protein